jgi:PPM family protein phosphatase
MTGTTERRCPGCQAPAQEGDLFCEQCGARLFEEEPEPESGDRVELDLAVAAAISDRGRVHRRNEDAFWLEVAREDGIAMVVCDGISSASAGDMAARSAAAAAGERLAETMVDHEPDGEAAVVQAIEAAHAVVARVPWTRRIDRDAPSCTLVCALWLNGELVVGSVGDSRAYWIAPGQTRRLTTDDSWAEEQVAEGRLSPDQALADPRSHSITNWIGGDAPARPPRLTALHPDQPGRLLLCSDGLWNYLTGPAELWELVDRLPAGASAAAVARALTDTALVRGGRDNITISVADIDP